ELRTEIERQSEKSADYNETNGDEINIRNVDVGSPDYLGPFDTMELAEEKLSIFAESKDFAIRTFRSSRDKETNTKINVTYVCIYSGSPKPKKFIPKSDQKAHRNTESQRKNCPFEAYIGRKSSKKFYIKMKNCEHNHQPTKNELSMHSYRRQLNEQQIALVATLYKAGASPTSIMATLNERFPEQVLDKRSIYNATARVRLEELDGHTPIQFLVNKLSADKSYIYETAVNNENGRLESLFLLKKESLEIFN
ncbi:hypothetical protein, partial, partial [Parasitella parasitica]